MRTRALLRRHILQHRDLQRAHQEAALERGRLLDQFERLTVSCRRLTKTLEDRAAYQLIVSQFAELAPGISEGPWVSLWLYDPLAYSFVLKAALPEATEWLTTNRLSLKEEPIATVANERKLLILPTLPQTIRQLLQGPSIGSEGAGFIPLTIEDRLLAVVLLIGSREQLGSFQRNILTVNLFAAQASLAVWTILQRELAMLDHLTRAYNYAYFKERLVQELERCHRFESPLSLLLIDIDGFKAINDTYGHQVGDWVLITTARTIQGSIRSMDLLARYGGDEFVVMLAELDRGKNPGSCEALPLAQRIRQAIAHRPVELPSQVLSVTVSIGIGIREPHAAPSFDAPALFKQADEQLYRAKRAGKNRCAFPDGQIVGPQ